MAVPHVRFCLYVILKIYVRITYFKNIFQFNRMIFFLNKNKKLSFSHLVEQTRF